MPSQVATTRRQELLKIAAELFATKGFKNTTVRDIADAAGILSGSLYHHFDSKESMVDELLDTFQQELFAAVRRDPRRRPHSAGEARCRGAGVVRGDRRSPQRGGDLPERRGLPGRVRAVRLSHRAQRPLPQLWTGLLQEAVDAGELRADLDVELVYRFLRDTVWVAVTWYRPGGALSADEVASQYLSILFEGIADHP